MENEEKIHVSVRLRPLNAKETTNNDVTDWECIDHKTIAYKNVSALTSERSMYPTSYTFDRVFSSSCCTREVYEQGAKDVAVSVVSGVNSTVFAYGQTSSGKTYTMTGITEYAIADVYDYIEKHQERDFVLKFSAMEIYNESVRDLLSEDTTPLRLLDDPERGTIVEKLTEEILKDRSHAIQILSICEAQRQIGETSLNELSSRSHQIIRLTIESSSHEFLGRDNTGTLSAVVNFVDLAGSERASQSLSAGARLKEGCHINRSLLTLGTVIRKLSKGRNGHIPFRDSKLTRILQTSLNGNATTAIICTMSPARSHVEQSRNTLLFASCAKEVTTNARVNVVMSDKLLVKHLRKELERVESELKNFHSNSFVPPNYFAALRDKDSEIEKLEKEIKDLILQRDIARAQVQDLLKMLGDDAASGSMIRACTGEYPHLRVQRSPDVVTTPDKESSIFADDNELLDVDDDDARTCSDDIFSRTMSEDHLAKVPHFDENFVGDNISPMILPSSSSSISQRWNDDDEYDRGKLENENSEDDLCKEVHCIETEQCNNNREVVESNLDMEEINDPYPAFKVSSDGGDVESPLPPLSEDVRNKGEKDDAVNDTTPSNEGQECVYESVSGDKDLTSPVPEKKDLRQVQHCDEIGSLDKGSFGNTSFKLRRSKSLDATCATDLDPFSWFKFVQCSDNNTPSSFITSEKEHTSPVQRSSEKDCESLSENEVDIEIDPANELSTSELHTEQENTKVKDDDREPIESPQKKNVKDVGLDPINIEGEEEEEPRTITSWPVEFNRLQREIIELWHACNVSLIHRSYFFLLFQGDPTDAIYLQVEIRRMRFLKEKFNKGEKTIVNGQSLTLSSSAKALKRERKMLSEQMLKKFTEEYRERLFGKWGIHLNSKWRRMQLAQRLWTDTEDVSGHVTESAILVAKLVGFLEPDKTPDKEMFGLNFTPKCSTRICSFKRSLVSLM